MAPNLAQTLLLFMIFPLSVDRCFNLNLDQKPQQPQQPQQSAEFRIHQTVVRQNSPSSSQDRSSDLIYLESMEDLEHVAYLSMRNFNMTDESLLQSSWLMGLGNTLAHKQHQKPAASLALSANDVKNRLALMLESFISHLRNGHLRRLTMEELKAVVEQLKQPINQQQQDQVGDVQVLTKESPAQNQQPNSSSVDWEVNKTEKHKSESQQLQQPASSNIILNEPGEIKKSDTALDRCQHLVTIYKFELRERQKSAQRISEYESGSVSSSMVGEQQQALTLSQSLNGEQFDESMIDENRLMRLCGLAVKCHSADELVNLISGSWRAQQASSSISSVAIDTPESSSHPKRKRQSSYLADNLQESNKQDGLEMERLRPKSLRDSLSLSVAKLCPLILFQLHDDDGLCTVRRDDRPPMVTVWGFATLFVTIVSFCSLIGLSITPLLGPTTTEDSSATEDSALDMRALDLNSPHKYSRSDRLGSGGHSKSAIGVHDHNQPANRACLTLFEGLAVGSLVGSALFSLIPQAFELQERESNQGFLLKAFIIFSGIYLFFCSERIMRIILDTRQQRKKKKRLNHRSSNSIPMPSTTADFDHHQQLLQQQQSQQQLSNVAGKQNRFHSMLRMNQQQQQQVNNQPSNGRKNPASGVTFNARLSSSSSNRLNQEQQQQQETTLHLRENRRQQGGSSVNQHIKIASQVVGLDSRVVNFPSETGKTPTRTRKQQPGESGSARQTSSSTQAVKQRRRDGSMNVSAALASNDKTILRRDNSQSKPSSTPGKRSTTSGGGGGKTRNSSTGNRVKRRKTRHQLLLTKQRQLQRNKKVVHQNQLLPLSAVLLRNGSGNNNNNSEDEMKFHQQQHLDNNRRSPSVSPSVLSSSLSSVRSSEFESDSSTGNLANKNYSNKDESDHSTLASKARKEFPNESELDGDEDEDEDEDDDEDEEERQQDIWLMKQATSQQMRQQTNRRYKPDISRAQRHSCPHRQTSFRLDVDGAQSYLRPVSEPNTKQDISTVAWMIVLGDGLHNFIDGISIGAAFSESILSGVSISVAVICEEFPHELGDFAVLVSSGMTVRQALGYNFVSACTCYFGMAVGIILGDVNDGASYISALAAGVFLYIALVDMMGELSATLEKTSRDSITQTLKLLLLQNVGIFIGISIIFILSFIDF